MDFPDNDYNAISKRWNAILKKTAFECSCYEIGGRFGLKRRYRIALRVPLNRGAIALSVSVSQLSSNSVRNRFSGSFIIVPLEQFRIDILLEIAHQKPWACETLQRYAYQSSGNQPNNVLMQWHAFLNRASHPIGHYWDYYHAAQSLSLPPGSTLTAIDLKIGHLQ